MTGWNDSDLDNLRLMTDRIVKDTDRIQRTVDFLRDNGCPWSIIGESLGITRQAAQQRYGTKPKPKPDPGEVTLPFD